MSKKFVGHFNYDTLSLGDARAVLREYETLVKFIYNDDEANNYVRFSIETSIDYLNKFYKSYDGKIIKGE